MILSRSEQQIQTSVMSLCENRSCTRNKPSTIVCVLGAQELNHRVKIHVSIHYPLQMPFVYLRLFTFRRPSVFILTTHYIYRKLVGEQVSSHFSVVEQRFLVELNRCNVNKCAYYTHCSSLIMTICAAKETKCDA